MLQNPCKTLSFMKNMVYKIPPGGGEVNHIQPVAYIRIIIKPRREKTCIRSFLKGHTQTSLLSYRNYLENCNFASSKPRNKTFQYANNKGAGQTARMRRLICTFVVAFYLDCIRFMLSIYSLVHMHNIQPGANIHLGCKFASGVYFDHVNGAL